VEYGVGKIMLELEQDCLLRMSDRIKAVFLVTALYFYTTAQMD
jgi:hypothetical protein